MCGHVAIFSLNFSSSFTFYVQPAPSTPPPIAPAVCDGLTVVFMETILNSNGKPERTYVGTSEAECIIGTDNQNTIYGNGGNVSIIVVLSSLYLYFFFSSFNMFDI